VPQKPKFDFEMAEHLRALFHGPEWPYFATFLERLRVKWRQSLATFNLTGTIEQIGKEHVRWAAMVAGIDTMLFQMNELIEELNRLEKENLDGNRGKTEGT